MNSSKNTKVLINPQICYFYHVINDLCKPNIALTAKAANQAKKSPLLSSYQKQYIRDTAAIIMEYTKEKYLPYKYYNFFPYDIAFTVLLAHINKVERTYFPAELQLRLLANRGKEITYNTQLATEIVMERFGCPKNDVARNKRRGMNPRINNIILPLNKLLKLEKKYPKEHRTLEIIINANKISKYMNKYNLPYTATYDLELFDMLFTLLRRKQPSHTLHNWILIRNNANKREDITLEIHSRFPRALGIMDSTDILPFVPQVPANLLPYIPLQDGRLDYMVTDFFPIFMHKMLMRKTENKSIKEIKNKMLTLGLYPSPNETKKDAEIKTTTEILHSQKLSIIQENTVIHRKEVTHGEHTLL